MSNEFFFDTQTNQNSKQERDEYLDIDISDYSDSSYQMPDIIVNLINETNPPNNNQNNNNTSNQPIFTWFDNNQNQNCNSSRIHHKKPKTKLLLSESQQCFKDNYYNIFTPRKKFEKSYVIKIHNMFLVNNIKGFKKMSRDEERSIDLYFQNYAPYQEEIFKVLRKNKKLIIKQIIKKL